MSGDDSSAFAVVIPAYNEARTIRDTVARTLALIERVIVVDDGSTDGTAGELQGLPVTVLRNPRNLGKSASLRRGMAEALSCGAVAVITLDGDGQHLPEDIPRLIAKHKTYPASIVIGARLSNSRNIPLARYCANRFANFWVAWAAGYRISDSQSGFRVYPGSVLRALAAVDDRSRGFVFESKILIDAGRSGIQSITVPVAAIYPPGRRRSHFRPIGDIAAITRMVAWKLLSRGLYLRGLAASLRRSDPAESAADHDAPGVASAARSSRGYSLISEKAIQPRNHTESHGRTSR